MPRGADIVVRLMKAGLFALALFVASAVLASGASAHGAQHHSSMSASGAGHQAAPAAQAPDAPGPVPATVGEQHFDAGTACPDDDRQHSGHSGCCAGTVCCSVACSGAMALTEMAVLTLRTSAPPALFAASLLSGLGIGPGEHPPRPVI